MKSIQSSGKTVEDAIKAGLKELGLGPADVAIDVLDLGSPGLFGMFGRLARVKLTVKEADPELSFDMASLKSLAAPEKKAQAKPAKPEPKPAKPADGAKPAPESKPAEAQPAAEVRPTIEARPAAEPRPASQGGLRPDRLARPPRLPRPEQRLARPEREADPSGESIAAMAAATDLPPMDPATLTGLAREAYDFLQPLTTMMGVPVEIRAQASEGQVTVQMHGDPLGILIGRRGDTLDALQYLTSLKLNKRREEYVRVSLDTEHYRVKREAALQKLAGRMAMRVRRTGGRVALEPMNPYERRVLHSALQNDPYVTTHSEGSEPFRRVIITPKK
ncbi:MAG: KH domain-containing protein [Clostridiales bacterium]|nr:KH domain-containing protein [Clostridiales bacterium]